MRWVAAGKTDREIGAILDISTSTARFHMENVRSKLYASTRAHAVAILFARGLLWCSGSPETIEYRSINCVCGLLATRQLSAPKKLEKRRF